MKYQADVALRELDDIIKKASGRRSRVRSAFLTLDYGRERDGYHYLDVYFQCTATYRASSVKSQAEALRQIGSVVEYISAMDRAEVGRSEGWRLPTGKRVIESWKRPPGGKHPAQLYTRESNVLEEPRVSEEGTPGRFSFGVAFPGVAVGVSLGTKPHVGFLARYTYKDCPTE